MNSVYSMTKSQIIRYLEKAGIKMLIKGESISDAVDFVNGNRNKRKGAKHFKDGGPLPGFYTVRQNFVKIKTRN